MCKKQRESVVGVKSDSECYLSLIKMTYNVILSIITRSETTTYNISFVSSVTQSLGSEIFDTKTKDHFELS